MPSTIFFSWQSDTLPNIGRGFIKDALEEACKSLASDMAIDEAVRGDLSVDSDTQGVAGTPPIVETIFRKISEASVFVADMTFVSKRARHPVSNPNVLIEYGYALKSLTHERVLCVMNTALGECSEKTLPFNLRHVRWPIRYHLPENATTEAKREEKKKLVTGFVRALRLSLAAVPAPTEATAVLPVFTAIEPKDGPARFRAPEEALGIEDDFMYKDEHAKEVFLSSGPAMWLRLIPTVKPDKEWTASELKEMAMKGRVVLMPLLAPAGGYSYVRAADGSGMYRASDHNATSKPNSIEVNGVAFAFETGEVWSIETAWLAWDKDRLPFIEDYYVTRIRDYSEFLQRLSIGLPYRWIAGLTGVKHRHLTRPTPPGHQFMGDGPVCLTDTIEADGIYDGKQDAKEALKPFFVKIFKACGEPRPDYLDS